MKMNTPTAIFLGLALIAAAIFFRTEIISEAHASSDCATSSQLKKARNHIVDWIGAHSEAIRNNIAGAHPNYPDK